MDEARLSRTRTRKASPFFARGPPSRSRSHSRRHARRHRDSDDSSDSSSRSSRLSSSSSTSLHRRRRRRHRRSRRSSSFEEFSDAPFSSCVTAPAKYLVRKIRRGKFIKLDKLLPPVLDEALTKQLGKRSGGSKRCIGDFASWMEAWCIFMAIRVHAFPESGLQLVKYQTIMCQLFSSYQAAVCIKYDSLSRQAVARDKSRLVPWDQVKEDILVWCATRQPFRPKTNTFTPGNTSAQRSSTTGGQPTQSSGHITLSSTGKEICRRYNYGTCTRTSCTFRPQVLDHRLWWRPSRQGLYQGRRRGPWLIYASTCTTLRHSEFERELRNHPDKAWVSWLLHSILNGVSTGYKGPHTPYTARNLSSALQHPNVITSELQKEVAAGRVLGPFADRPLPSLRTPGLGAAAKKQGKWRMILHLSARYGASVNDGISKKEFSLHYSSVDDAVKLLHSYGKGAIMAKVDLKAAFRMVPVRAADWDLLGMFWKGSYYVDTCLPFGLRSAPCLFNHFAEALHWILVTNYQVEAIHFLDDFLIAGAAGRDLQCAASVRVTLSVCEHLGIPVAFDKLEGPSPRLHSWGSFWILRLLRFLSCRRNWLRSYCWYNPGLVGAGLQSESYCPSLASCRLRPRWYQLGVYFCAD